MKKVIKGKLYDTATAKKCGEYEPHPYRRDFNWYGEELYQKRTGEFFLYGAGNANSKYSCSCGQNEWRGDEKIIPLTYEQAHKWAEEHLDGDEYIKIFGEPEEPDSKTVASVSLKNSTLAKAKEEAAKAGISVSEYITNLIENA